MKANQAEQNRAEQEQCEVLENNIVLLINKKCKDNKRPWINSMKLGINVFAKQTQTVL